MKKIRLSGAGPSTPLIEVLQCRLPIHGGPQRMLNPHVRTMHKIDQEHKAHVTEGEQTIPPTLATPSHHGPSKALTKPTLRDQHNVMEEATFNPVRIHLEIDTREQVDFIGYSKNL